MATRFTLAVCLFFLLGIKCVFSQKENPGVFNIQIPFLKNSPTIDGNLSEWKQEAFHDGVWDIFRIRESAWYNPKRNKLTDHGNEPSLKQDLSAGYFMAWDSTFLYLGAEVIDNKNDITELKHEPKRWYYKDAIAWFFEAPKDEINESFGEGNNAFCFVIDTSYPNYGSWWRHGNEDQTFIEKQLDSTRCFFRISFGQNENANANFTLEARVKMENTFGESDSSWTSPKIGDEYKMMIVHCDPDGGEYGGHLLIYGEGDNDSTWTDVQLSAPKKPILRKQK